MTSTPIIISHEYSATVLQLWQALTEAEQLQQWLFEPIAEFKPEVGFTTRFDVQVEGQTYVHLWEVQEVTPQSRLAYRWRYAGYDGDSTVSWDFDSSGSGSNLTLTHAGIESFPQDNAIFARETGVAAWEYLMNESLRLFLETRA